MFQKQTCEHMRNITYFKEAAVEIQQSETEFSLRHQKACVNIKSSFKVYRQEMRTHEAAFELYSKG